MGPVIVTPATSYPVSTFEAQVQTRSDDGYQLNTLIAAATSYVEDYLGRSLMDQTWSLYLDGFSDSMILPKGPVKSVSSITYTDINGATQTLSTSVYAFDSSSDPQQIVLNPGQSWPLTQMTANAVMTANVVKITYLAGYATVPPSICMAIKFLISQWYDNRTPFSERVPTELPNTVAALLANHRAFGF